MSKIITHYTAVCSRNICVIDCWHRRNTYFFLSFVLFENNCMCTFRMYMQVEYWKLCHSSHCNGERNASNKCCQAISNSFVMGFSFVYTYIWWLHMMNSINPPSILAQSYVARSTSSEEHNHDINLSVCLEFVWKRTPENRYILRATIKVKTTTNIRV